MHQFSRGFLCINSVDYIINKLNNQSGMKNIKSYNLHVYTVSILYAITVNLMLFEKIFLYHFLI